MPGNELDYLGVPFSTFLLRFGRFERIPELTKLIPWKCPHSTLLFCFTRFEGDAR